MPPNPCLACGACCAAFRVAFHWREGADARVDGVPLALVEDWNSTLRIMRGTGRQPPRCAALLGTLGQAVRCSIHAQRPGPCREFSASWSEGRHEPRCDQARARHGLPPLAPADWGDPPDPERGPGDDPQPDLAVSA